MAVVRFTCSLGRAGRGIPKTYFVTPSSRDLEMSFHILHVNSSITEQLLKTAKSGHVGRMRAARVISARFCRAIDEENYDALSKFVVIGGRIVVPNIAK